LSSRCPSQIPAILFGLALLLPLHAAAQEIRPLVRFGTETSKSGEQWRHVARTTKSLSMGVFREGRLQQEYESAERQHSEAQVEFLAMKHGLPWRVRVKLVEAWTDEGDGTERRHHSALGGVFFAARERDRVVVLRENGSDADAEEQEAVLRHVGDLLGRGGVGPEEALLTALRREPLRLGQSVQLSDHEARAVFVGMPAEEAAGWEVQDAVVRLVELNDIGGRECCVLEMGSVSSRTSDAERLRVELNGRACVDTKTGRWLRSNAQGPIQIEQRVSGQEQSHDLKGAGLISLAGAWSPEPRTRRN
jgi:hypothetical protein